MKYLKLKFLLMFFALAMAIPPAWAEEVTYTMTLDCNANGNGANDVHWTSQTQDLTWNNVTWHATADNIISTGSTTDVQIGTGTKPARNVSISTSDFSGTIKKVIVTAKTAKDAVAYISISVNGISYKNTDLINSYIDYEGTGTSSGEIQINITQPTTSKALYIKQITVVYEGDGGDDPGPGDDPTPTGSKLYEKVTSASQIVDGKKYIFVYDTHAMGSVPTSTSGGFGSNVTVVNNNGIVDIEGKGVEEFTLGIIPATQYDPHIYYTFAFSNGSYLTPKGTKDSNLMQDSETTNAKWQTVENSGGFGVLSERSGYARGVIYQDGGSRFGHYAKSNVDNSAYGYGLLYVEKDDGNRVATPTFDPAGGNYNTPQNVTISCETDGATIYYTTDGSDPDNTSTEYTGPITVDQTMTLKAIAVADDMENSYVATATYTLPVYVNNFADANALPDNTNFTYTKKAVVVYRKNAQMWIQDENASTGGGFVYTSGLTYSPGDVIKEGWSAKKITYSATNPQYPEFEDFVSEANGTTQNPIAIKRSTLSIDNIHEYVLLENVEISENNSKLWVTLPGSRAQYELYDTKLGECEDFVLEANTTYNVTGLVGKYGDNLQIYPLSITKYVQPGEPTITITAPEVLPFNDEGGIYTVNGSSLPTDGLGVNVSEGFDRYLENGNNEYYYFPLTNGAVTDGRTKVTYTGRELSATGTITYKSGSANETADLSYRADIYLYGNFGNGWGYPEDAKFDYANGIYNKTFSIEGTTFLLFSRKAGENYSWDTNRLFFSPVTDGNNWVYNNIFEDDLDLNPIGQYHPIELNSPGEYTITINPVTKRFTINKVVHQVETPVISPEGGNYNTIQTVTITAADGATIHYTTDGTEPTESSTLYEGPITVDHSMTIKAIAVMDGMDNSEVATATYNLPTSVNTLAAANALEKNTEFLFTGDAVVTYHNGDYTFLRDVNATAGGGLIYQSGINLAQGVVLKKGWDAKRDDYRGEKEYINAINVENSGTTADFTPFDRTGVAFDDTHMNEYVTFNNVTITGKELDQNSGKYTYTGTYTDGNRANVDYILHNQFDLNNIEEGRTYNVTGVVTKRDDNMQVYPTAVTLVQQDPNMSFAEETVNATFGADFTEPELTKPEDVTVKYSSDNTEVAEVNETTGEVTIKKIGNAKITATSVENDYYTVGTASYNIVVSAGTPTFAYSAETKEVVFGTENPELPTLNNPNSLTVTYTSSKPEVATVATDGKVTIVGVGETVITATGAATGNYAGAESQYTLTVTAANPTFAYSAEAKEVVFGTENPELPTLNNPNSLNVTYTSSKPEVATVATDGKVTIVGIGETVITATGAATGNYNGAEASYTLTVTAANPTFAYSAATASAVFGQTATLPTLSNPNNLTVTYTSSKPEVATVNENGVVTIVGAGTTVITATGAATGNYGAATASYELTVSKADLEVSFNETPDPITIGDSFTAPVLSEVPEGTTVTYKSSNENVAKVNATTGEVEIVGVGSAVITATVTGDNYNETSVSYTITVNDVVVALAAPTFAPAAGTYTEPKEVAIACATPGVTITYAIDGVDKGEYNGPFTISDGEHTVTATAKMGTRTVYTPATSSATYKINVLPAAQIDNKYYYLVNNALPEMYANVAGRRTLNFVADPADKAGTVFRIATDGNGKVLTLRSQACDIQDYAKRAMNYVPVIVQTVINKLNNTTDVDSISGAGNLLGENGLQALLDKFNECFDYNLYVEGSETAYRIYARTPSMQNVVDFYAQHKDQVDEKLPDLEDYINQVLAKIRSKVPAPYNANVFEPFSLLTVWEEMGGTLIKPDTEANVKRFYEQVLTNKEYVWNFAATTAKHYLDNIKGTQTYQTLVTQYPDINIYVSKLEEIRPETKFFIIQNGNEPDYVGETHTYIVNDNAQTYWTLAERTGYDVAFPAENVYNGQLVTTLYTDFAYDVPDGVTAYKVTGVKTVNEQAIAEIEALNGTVPAQTPVLLMTPAAKANVTKTVTLNTNDGTPIENELKGPDYLIKQYGITSPTVEFIFNAVAGIVPADMLAKYEYLKLRTSGTVNNKYFWNVNDALDKCTYKDANNEDDCVVRSLVVKDGTLAFSEHWKTETNKAFLVSETDEVIYLAKAVKPTFDPFPGSYNETQTVKIDAGGAEIEYSTDGGNTWNPYTGPITVDKDMTIIARTEGVGETAEATGVYVINKPVEPITIDGFKGYFQIKNNGNGKYANVAGRKTLTFTDDPTDKAGTVIYADIQTDGKVISLRSQAADLQRYADRAMSYVPDIVELVADKLKADGEGNLLGHEGLEKIMEKFKASFDHHLYVEQVENTEGGYRIYGKTPSMQPVVDFYRENTAQVEAKLPMLESFINSALNKLKEKIGGSSVFTPFSLLNIWERMGGTLTKPEDEASTMAFYREVLNNKNYVWDFAYQTAMIYLNNIKGTQTYLNLVNEHPEISQYIDKIDQIRPDFKYYIVQKDDKPDFISQGNVDIINNEARTIWTLEERKTFKLNSAGEMFGCPLATNGVGGYFTTNYTDFAYTLPEGVTAYKVTGVNDEGEATLEALSGTIPAQTPVLLVAKEDKPYELTLTTDAGTAVTSNLLVGPDYLINEYDLKTAQVQGIFDMIKQKLGQDFYNNYVAQYEHLADLNSGTVNNKYFWNVNSYLDYCTYKNANNEDECVVRSLATNENGELAFSEHWKTETNKAFLVSDTFDVITLPRLERGDVNHDGFVNLIDVTDLIDRLLVIPDAEHLKACPYCSDVDGNGSVSIKDVTVLIDILLENPATEPEGGDGN